MSGKIRSISFEDCLDKMVLDKKSELAISVTAYVKACVMADLFPELRLNPAAKLNRDEIRMLNTYASQDFSDEYLDFIHFRMAKVRAVADQSEVQAETLDVPKWVSEPKDTKSDTNDSINTSVDTDTKTNTDSDSNANSDNNTNTKQTTKKKPKKPFKMDDMSIEGTCI